MKTKVFVLSIVILLLFGFCTTAQDTEYSIVVPKDFAVTHKNDNIPVVAERLGLSQKNLTEYFTENGLLYLAVSNDAKTQVRLSAFSDNFSSEVADIIYLNDVVLNEFISAVCGNNDYEIVQKDDRKFLVSKNVLQDSGGVYTVTQYITIANNKTYYLSCYNEGNNTSEQIADIFKNYHIVVQTEKAPDFTMQSNLILLAIIVFSIIVFIMIISIVKSVYKKVKVSKDKE